MGLISSMFGSVIGLFLPDRPYWAIKRTDGKWLCELDRVYDTTRGEKRPLDWTLDLVSTGDVRRIQQLWLFGPPNQFYPFGQSDFLQIREPGTVFQLKVGNLLAGAEDGRLFQSQLIGRVDDLASGACSCKVWDAHLNVIGNWSSQIQDMGSWREGIAPLGTLSHDVLGLRSS